MLLLAYSLSKFSYSGVSLGTIGKRAPFQATSTASTGVVKASSAVLLLVVLSTAPGAAGAAAGASFILPLFGSVWICVQ